MLAMGGCKVGAGVLLIALFVMVVSVEGQAPIEPPIAGGLALTPGPAPAPLDFAPAPEPAPLWPPCDGVDIVYQNTLVEKIYPFLNDTPWLQPYKFTSVVTITNMGYSTVEGWAIGMNFSNSEILVSAEDMYLEDGRLMPVDVSNGTILTQVPAGILKNAIETAGDFGQIRKTFLITGTEFGQKKFSMPKNINITQKGYNCSVAETFYNVTMHTCCSEPNRNVTLTDEDFYLPSEQGNFTITYDVTQAYPGSYLALVTISNDSPMTRLDNWNLSWTWKENEFITKMLGATTRSADLDVCLNGIAGKTFTQMDLNKALCCSRSPEIIDLPLGRINDTQVGGITFCCRNGTIWPAVLDPEKSKSAFMLDVMKLPPQSGKLTSITPPGNWRLGDGRFQCGPPRRITPTIFPDPYLAHDTAAFKTWQVTCNETAVERPRKCCVSFSKYTNESIVPCRTCACGCPEKINPVCDANASSMLLPYSAITLHPENRTAQILAWAALNHINPPNPLPCQDYCGVAINWHIVSNFTGGWSSRMTLFDWSNTTYPDWFTVVEMPNAYLGFEKAYSFNATAMPPANNTAANTSLLVQGLEGLNYLMAATNLSAGKLQSVFSFTKKTTPNIREADYFPTKIYFNGEECTMPEGFPINSSPSMVTSFVVTLVVVVMCTMILIL